MRGRGIFTAATISPSYSPRQRPARYTIRAGRNLPDKEFRYLRTVIVTAAVYWGFNSVLAHLLLTFQHRAGVRPYTSNFFFAESCVLVKQSLPPLMCHLCQVSLARYLLSLSYEVNLPSSFNTILSSALVYSTHPPVSVWGTVYTWGLFPGSSSLHTQSIKSVHLTTFVTSHRSRNINRVPIDYDFRPRLRGRLTLR